MPNYQYLCKDESGEYFITTEKCASIQDAKQYVGSHEVLYPLIYESVSEKESLNLLTLIGMMRELIDSKTDHHPDSPIVKVSSDMVEKIEEFLNVEEK